MNIKAPRWGADDVNRESSMLRVQATSEKRGAPTAGPSESHAVEATRAGERASEPGTRAQATEAERPPRRRLHLSCPPSRSCGPDTAPASSHRVLVNSLNLIS